MYAILPLLICLFPGIIIIASRGGHGSRNRCDSSSIPESLITTIEKGVGDVPGTLEGVRNQASLRGMKLEKNNTRREPINGALGAK